MATDREAAEEAGPRLEREPASSPARLGLRSWRSTLKRTAEQFMEDHLLQWAAALAFFAVISLFPAMLALVSLLGLIGGPAIDPLIDNLAELAPGPAREIALGALESIQASSNGASLAFIIAVTAALWTASGYVGAFIPAANIVWEADESRPILRKLLVRISLTMTLLVLVAITAVSVVLTGPVAQEVGSVVGVGEEAVGIWQIAKWPFLAFVVTLLLAILYWASPNVRQPGWRWVTPGSVLAVLLWILASLGFTFYVANFGSYNATYGSIGGVLVFLLWLWISNIAILLGAELNAELERTRAIDAGMRPEDRTPFLPLRHGDGDSDD